MKPSTSKVDGKKRKREPPPAVPESAKKSKVHAQRKFAQGSGLASPAASPVKDREKMKAQPRSAAPTPEPLLTNRVPTTGQFLDFLCFGRTSLLPTTLHYLRDASLPNSSTSSASSPQLPATPAGKKAEKSEAEKVKPPACVQALRKKYQEQRLAKQKATSVTKLAKKVKGKNMVRTRSSVVKDDLSKAVKSVLEIKSVKKTVIGLRSGLNKAHKAVAIVKAQKLRADKAKLQRAGLRSGGKLDDPKTVAKESSTSKTKKTEQEGAVKAKSSVARKKAKQPSGGDVGSDFSSDDNEPLLTHKKPKLRAAQNQQLRTRSQATHTEEVEKTSESRPSRRTKVVTPACVEEMSRKLTVGSPPPHGDGSSAEIFPEQPASRREKREPEQKPCLTAKKLGFEKMASKGSSLKKNVVKNVSKSQAADSSPNRPSTRSTPSSEKPPEKILPKTSKKTVIRDLIQKKKQMSLRTLSRIKNLSSKIKPGLSSSKSDKKGGPKMEKKESAFGKKSDTETEPSRRLRGKNAESVGPPEKVSANKVRKQTVKKPLEVKAKEPAVENKGKAKLRAEVSESIPSKRPVRKCSTVDKMWIDVDGFTSDEEDFIDIESITASTGDKKSTVEATASTKVKTVGNTVDSVAANSNDDADATTSNKGKVVNKPTESTGSNTSDTKSAADAPVANKGKSTSEAAVSANTCDSTPSHKGKIATKVVETSPTSDKKSTADTPGKGKCGNKGAIGEAGRREEVIFSKKPVDSSAPPAGKETRGKKSEKKDESALKLQRNSSSDAFVENTMSSTATAKKEVVSKPGSGAAASQSAPSLKLENNSPNLVDKNSSGTGVKPFLVETAVTSPLCNLPTKIGHQPVPEIIPKEASPVIPTIKATLPLSPSKSAAWLVPKSISATNEPWKGKIQGGASLSYHSSAVVPSPASQLRSSDAVIARLAANVSMTSKPSSLTLDLKSVTKDLKTVPTPSAYSSMIKEEKVLKIELKVSADKKHIGVLCAQSCALETQKVTARKTAETKASGSECPSLEQSSIRSKMDLKLFKEESTTASAKTDTVPKVPDTSFKNIQRVSSVTTDDVDSKKDLILPTVESRSKVTPMTHRQKVQRSSVALQAEAGTSSKKEASRRPERGPLVSESQKEKFFKYKGEESGNRDKNKSGVGDRTVKSRAVRGSSIQKSQGEVMESSDDSSDSSEGLFRSSVRSSGKRVRKPSPRAEVVTRRERPKRQCSATGKSWIERDSDDSSFYDDGEEDVLELIRRSELALKEREEQKQRAKKIETSVDSKESDTFSDSDDEPLLKKTLSAFSPGSPMTNDTSEVVLTKNFGGKSEVSQECVTRAGTSGLNGGRDDHRDTVPAPAVTFLQVPGEPINTDGLDLLSEVVAVADRGKSNERIEQWLKESLRADAGKGFVGFDESEIRRPPLPSTCSSIPDPVLQFIRSTPEKLKAPSEVKKMTVKPEMVLKRPPVSSVTDLLKLQKERKESPKPSTEQHSKNCKCNSCVVKKAWFKNKPAPDDAKSMTKGTSPPKPFQALTQAFGEVSTAKASVSVAPFIHNRDSSDGKPSGARKLSFLERMRERERKESLVKHTSQPFSPSNESSVYAFEPEVERQNATPARPQPRPATRTTSASTSHDEVPDNVRHQSTSIAVQVNLDTSSVTPEPHPVDDGKSNEISTQTEGADEDPDSQMYYIPLQQSSVATICEQSLIQGVAVKLGTHGPLGPNQKLVMQAKLVTTPPRMPSMQAVVMPQQKLAESIKNTPPVGTVQPTTRRPPGQIVSPRLRDAISPSSTKARDAISPSSTKARDAISPSSTKARDAISPSSTKARDAISPRSTKVRDAQMSIRLEVNSQTSPGTPLRVESPPMPSTPRPPKPPSKPAASETRTSSAGFDSKDSSMLMEAPTFHLTEKEFQDPLEFFERIRPAAEHFGLCRIVPPSSFKPDCKVADDMRFTAYNQYVHRMLHRWGPSVKETMAMKKYLKTQRISLKPPPCVGGMEVDLPRLYQAVQTCGGLMKVMDKQKWQQVADLLRIPKAAHDRATKLDAIYCQYLLPYDTLKTEERDKLLEEVDADWTAHEDKMGLGTEPEGEEEEEDYIEECEECIVKGRSMALNQFYRIARNTMSMWFKSPEPGPEEVEAEFWRHVTERKHHVCVHSGSIDSSGWGYGFPVGKNNFAKHPWNLKVLTNNSGSVLRSLGPVMGVTVPTLHVGMVFAAFCWYRDPHGLPWVEYLHTGAPKIWYGISDDNSTLFREALTKLLPKHIKERRIWLPCDTAMAPPERLAELGVPLSRTTQHPGQFVLVFPRAFTSSLCTGYLVSESVYFARPSWLQTAEQAFRDIHDSAEPSVFSLDNLLLSIAGDTRASLDILHQVLPMVRRVRERERSGRRALRELGVTEEGLPREAQRRRGRSADPEPEHECDVCRASLFLSMVSNAAEETVYCLHHGLEQLTTHPDQLPGSKLLVTHDQDEINQIVEKLEERIDAKVLKNSKK